MQDIIRCDGAVLEIRLKRLFAQSTMLTELNVTAQTSGRLEDNSKRPGMNEIASLSNRIIDTENLIVHLQKNVSTISN